MNVMSNNPIFYVIEYPDQDALEIFDKRNRRGGLMQGALAQRFRLDLGEFALRETDEDELETFLDAYSAMIDQPLVKH